MVSHGINAQAATTSALSGMASFIFGVPVAVVLAAFAGACLSLSLSAPRKFLGSVMHVVGGTVAAAFSTPLILHFVSGLPERAVAFAVGFAVMHMLPSIADVLKGLPKELKDKWLSR